MTKKDPKPSTPFVGDHFAVPLEGGWFTVCRVLEINPLTETLLVANANWIGRQVPAIGNPALRSILRLTHHSWGGQLSAGWVSGAPPRDFIPFGNIPSDSGDNSIAESDTCGWAFFRIQPQEQWLWDHPQDIPPPEPSPAGRFILHRFNGDEIYHFNLAVIWAYETESGATLWFEVAANSQNASRCDDTAEMGMAPNAEVGIELNELDVNELVGREFVIPGTKSDAEDSCMSTLYYCEHEALATTV